MKAIISGICGMDASHLADLLLDKGYEVIGFYRRSSNPKFDRIEHLSQSPKFRIQEGDITDSHYIANLLKEEQPDVFYNAAAQSHVGTSFKQPRLTFEVNTGGVLNILEGIKNESRSTRLIQFSTSEMWGNNIDDDDKQRETTPFAPRSPYAVSKMAAFDLCRTYRESYNIFACSSICHNHTGPRRGDNFVEKKIINWVAKNHDDLMRKDITFSESHYSVPISEDYHKAIPKLALGNIHPCRDFLHSKDCVKAIHMMSLMEEPKDYVISSGKATSVADLLDKIFGIYNLNYQDFYVVDPQFYRPAEVNYLCGDSTKIQTELGWKPEYSLDDIIKEMHEDAVSNRKVQSNF